MKHHINRKAHKHTETRFEIDLSNVRRGVPVCLKLRNLNGSVDDKRKALEKILVDAYEKAKATFEDSDADGNHVRNGTFKRKVLIRDPDEDIQIRITIKLQRYMDKKAHTTKTFYGGILMPFISHLAYDVVTILANRAEYEASPYSRGENGDRISLSAFCKEWGIRKDTYLACRERAMACIRTGGSLEKILLRFLNGSEKEALSELAGLAG